ncbi:MAG: fibronectin type III domain-containing protein [Prolixibacteraceae bacterium]|nr:fibronectin type III domain-containing protein [Prolixibacteraceae bacterium]
MKMMKSIYRKFAKRTLLLILIVHFSMLSFAATYFVSNSGNDTNSGLTEAMPWQTLAKVNATTFVAGDQILFKKGNTFYGSITVKNSGTAGNPITFGAYGTGANPIITGFTSVTAWVNLGNNVWESANAVSTLSTCNMVTINGVNTAMGRWPNSDAPNGGYLTYQSHSGKLSVTSSSLTGTPNWTGANAVIRTNRYTMAFGDITSQTGGTLNFSTALTSTPTDGYGFFIQNDIRTLDVQGEWYYNPTSHKISIYSTSEPIGVKVSSVENLLAFTGLNNVAIGSYTIIKNIDFIGSNGDAIYVWKHYSTHIHHVTIQNCNISFTGYNGIWLRGNYLSVIDNEISETNRSAINLQYSKIVSVENNILNNISLTLGKGSGYADVAIAAFTIKSANINYNKITNCGFNGISFDSDSTIIASYNFIDHYCLKLDDGGAISTGGNNIYGGKIISNICTNGIGNYFGTPDPNGMTVGIYCDDNSQYIEAAYNTAYNCGGVGLFFHNSSNNNIHHNISYNNDYQLRIVDDNISPAKCLNNIFKYNILVSKSAAQTVADFYSISNDLLSNGSILDSNYYARPIDNNIIIRDYQPAFGNNFKTLAQWQTYSGQDANSKKSPQTITSENDLRFEYNETTSPKTIALSVPMLDVKGTKYIKTITLQPFTSVVLMKDLSPVIVPGAPTSVVAIAGNASASVTFVAPENNGGSAITGYTVASIPAGGTDSNSGSTSLTHTITGLTNGTTYTFTVKTTNSAGTSVASVASNSVIPKAPAATGFLFTGPLSGSVNSPSANFTVIPNNLFTGTITITPTGPGSVGLSSKVLTFSNSSTAQTFTITPTVAGSVTLTATNNGTLTNPANLTYTLNAIVPDAPTTLVAAAGDTSATVTFIAPTNTGGSAITGYTITSIPAGGTDINAGSTSLIHNITGLTNGTSYTFTVKASNSLGSSVASVASNSVIPVAADVIIKQGSIPPTHFIPVWNGENGLNHMNIMVVSAILEDLPLSPEDEIAVFSGSNCVGSMKLSKTINADDNSTFLTIPASQDDGSGNGFTINDTIVFKIWDNKNQQEMIAKAVVYRNNISTWLCSGKYVAGGTSVVEIVSYTEYSQTIPLKKGYNMMSTFVTAQNPLACDVTQSLADAGYLIKLQDEAGNSLEDWGTFGGWVNNVGSIKDTEGYKIKVSDNCSLQLTGRPIALPLDIPLRSGWNIISFPRTDLVDAMNIIQPLIDQNKLIKVQDESGNSIEDWGIFGGWKNGIGYFIPGKAYKVKMTSDAILTIQENYLKSVLILANLEEPEYFTTEVEGNGSDHVNINVVGLREAGISAGDELAAFDGNLCVGVFKITGNNAIDGSAALVASVSSGNQANDGFTEGHAIQLIAWNKLTGAESKVQSDVISGQMKYIKNSSVLLKAKTLTTGISNSNDISTIDVFPNPSHGKVTVRFSSIPDAGSRIDILDVSGRKVASRIVTGMVEEFQLGNQPVGVYLVKTMLGSAETINKLVIN